jgi:hypothetical protein
MVRRAIAIVVEPTIAHCHRLSRDPVTGPEVPNDLRSTIMEADRTSLGHPLGRRAAWGHWLKTKSGLSRRQNNKSARPTHQTRRRSGFWTMRTRRFCPRLPRDHACLKSCLSYLGRSLSYTLVRLAVVPVVPAALDRPRRKYHRAAATTASMIMSHSQFVSPSAVAGAAGDPGVVGDVV